MTVHVDARARSTSRHRAALRRWSRLAIVLGTIGVVASEVAGGAWPITFVTPLARQLAAMLAIGAAGLLIDRSLRARREKAAPTSVGRERLTHGQKTGPLKRTRPAGIVLVTLYAALVALGAIPWRDMPTLARAGAIDATLGEVKILAANVHSSNLDRDALPALIARERPDVIVLTELTSSWIAALKSLDAEYPVREVVADDAGNFGLGVWSRLPGEAKLIVRQRLAQPSLLDVAHAEMTLTVDGQAIRVFGLHPLPPLTPAMKGARDALLRSIADDVAKGDVPTIVAGDLNATRYCRITRELCTRAKLSDAIAGVGTSWPMTLARPILGIRIDHVLATGAWRVVDAYAGEKIGSDHLPMIATLRLTRGKNRNPL